MNGSRYLAALLIVHSVAPRTAAFAAYGSVWDFTGAVRVARNV
jgi:hypothetical protein